MGVDSSDLMLRTFAPFAGHTHVHALQKHHMNNLEVIFHLKIKDLAL
jgi:hypothetical protein